MQLHSLLPSRFFFNRPAEYQRKEARGKRGLCRQGIWPPVFKFLEIRLCISLSFPRGGGYSHTLPIRVCVAQRGPDFEARDLEQGIHFRGVF